MNLTLNNYKKFISDFRHELGVGYPPNRQQQYVDLVGNPLSFRYQVSDLYLVYTKRDNGEWIKLTRGNYAQMAIYDDSVIGRHKIREAVQGNGTLALAILATAEAARSQVIYQIIQQMLQDGHKQLEWRDFKPILIGSWIYNTSEHHKRRPIEYGALRRDDYYNKEAKDAITAIIEKRFMLA